MPREIERKFLLAERPQWLDECEERRIEQGYLVLGGALEVRLRRVGGETLLTVKLGEGEAREEVEVPVDRRHFAALWPLTAGRRLSKTRRLVPIDDEHVAEVDVYDGDLEGLIVAEVEFGSEEEARDFEPPAWLSTEVTGDRDYANQSLAERGMPAGRGQRSRRYRLRGKEPIPEGIRRIAHGRLAAASERLRAGNGDAAEAIHGARKDMKKLRAVLRLVRDQLGEDAYRAGNRCYRKVGRLLSAPRDAEVKARTLAALADRYGDELPGGPAAAWRHMLESERDERLADPGGELAARIEKARGLIAEGGAEVEGWALDGDPWDTIEPGLERGYRRARKAMGRARSSRSAEDVHEWRKRAKDHWYHLRLLRGAWKPVMETSADQAHELADLLGDHHDLAVLAEDLEARGSIGESEAIADLIEERQAELLDQALGLGCRVFAEKPKAFRRRLRAYGLAWR